MSESRSLTQRMVGAALLDVDTYEEVEHDSDATVQAGGVVALVAACSAIGSWGSPGMLSAAWTALVGWLLWSAITWFIGTRMFGGQASWGELLRTVGFAHSPGVLAIAGLLPLIGGMVRFALFFWLLAAGIVAIRQALDVTTGKAVLTAVVGWIPMVMLARFFM